MEEKIDKDMLNYLKFNQICLNKLYLTTVKCPLGGRIKFQQMYLLKPQINPFFYLGLYKNRFLIVHMRHYQDDITFSDKNRVIDFWILTHFTAKDSKSIVH